MGNKLFCCLTPTASRKSGWWHCGWVESDDGSGVYQRGSRNSKAVPPALEPAELNLQACEGHRVLHISDLEMPEELASELIPSDHPRASTIFLKKSQMDVQGKRKKNFSYHVSLSHLTEKYSSCSTIFLDDSTICHPNLGITVQCLALAIYYHIKNRDADRSSDIFDERLHPFTQERAPEEHFNRDPDPDSIYRFISPFFCATLLRAEYAITTLVYLERLLIYAEIDICPTNWKRIVLGAIILASKYLHDLAIWNSDFCDILRSITVEDMNEMERHFLDLLEFRLNISASVYAKYYFDLRTLARDHGLPIVFAPLQKERAQNLEGKNEEWYGIIKSPSSTSTRTKRYHSPAQNSGLNAEECLSCIAALAVEELGFERFHALIQSLSQLKDAVLDQYSMWGNKFGELLFPYPVLLTKSIENIKNEIEDSTEPLIHPIYGHGRYRCANTALTFFAELLGIHEQAAVGVLTLMEALRYCKELPSREANSSNPTSPRQETC